MKQGRASSSSIGSTKREPISKPVNISAVANIGNMVGTRRAAAVPLYSGRGVEAPKSSSTTHRGGSQGKY